MIPRNIPLLRSLSILLGSPAGQFGWLFAGFTMIFVWLFIPSSDLSDFPSAEELLTADAQPVASEPTNNFVNGECIYKYTYTFTAEDGQTYPGTSYAAGWENEDPDGPPIVEYSAANPSNSRIRGMRRKPFGSIGLLAFFFPGIGLLFILAGLRGRRRALKLLKWGELAQGVLVGKEGTNATFNDMAVYQYTFAFTAEGGQEHQITSRTHREMALEDEPREPLLYFDYAPEKAVMMDTLPSSPRLDENGELTPAPLVTTILPLLVPGGIILAHSIYGIIRLLG